jgi:hypothetical protein
MYAMRGTSRRQKEGIGDLVPGTVIDRDYPGSRPRGEGSLYPATTYYNGTMCTGYNGCVGRYAICYVFYPYG